MDWDGVGTFALFLASGAVGISLVMLRAYKLKLEARLERERLRRQSGADSEELMDKLEALEATVDRLTDRVDFTERLIGSGEQASAGTEGGPAD